MRSPGWLGLSVLIAASVSQAQVASPPQRKEAATHYQRGVSLSKDGDFQAALAEFRAAHQAAPSFEVLFNIAFCERRTFKYGQSLRTFAEYLKQGGAKVAADRRAAVAKEIEAIRALTAPIAVIVEGEPASISVDGEREGSTPLIDFIPLGPGKHVVRAEREGDVAEERAIEVVSGQAQAVQFKLRSLTRPMEVVIETRPAGAIVSVDGDVGAASPRTVQLKPGTHEMVARLAGHSPARTDVVVQPGEPRNVKLELVAVNAGVVAVPSRPFPVVGVSLLSAGLIAGGLGVYFAAQASAASSQVTTFARPGAVTWDQQWANTERAGLDQQLAARVLFGGGGALALSGVIAIIINAVAEPVKPTAATLLILPSPTGATASCVVSF